MSGSTPVSFLAALTTLLLYPVLGFAVAIAGAGMISPRCVIPVCCAFGIAFALLIQRLFGHSRRAVLTVILSLVVWVSARECVCANLLFQQRQSFLTLRDQVASLGSTPLSGAPGFPLARYQWNDDRNQQKILIADSSFALPLYFYSSAAIRRRIILPIDFPAIHQYERDDSGEQNLWAGHDGVFPFPIAPFSSVTLAPGETVIASPTGWLAHLIHQRNLTLNPIPQADFLWNETGGVFTPMAHPSTRILQLTP